MQVELRWVPVVVDCYGDDHPTVVLPGASDEIALQCIQDWTTILFAGSGNFDLTFAEYESGFGSFEDENYWLGNRVMNFITSGRDYNLRVDLWGSDSSYTYAEFDRLWIQDLAHGYQIQLGEYLGGTAVEGALMSEATFHAKDQDNLEGCAGELGGGWWYGSQTVPDCRKTTLTGNVMHWGNTGSLASNSTISLLKAVMRIRPDRGLSASMRNTNSFLLFTAV